MEKEITIKDIQAVRQRSQNSSVAQVVTGDIVEVKDTEKLETTKKSE